MVDLSDYNEIEARIMNRLEEKYQLISRQRLRILLVSAILSGIAFIGAVGMSTWLAAAAVFSQNSVQRNIKAIESAAEEFQGDGATARLRRLEDATTLMAGYLHGSYATHRETQPSGWVDEVALQTAGLTEWLRKHNPDWQELQPIAIELGNRHELPERPMSLAQQADINTLILSRIASAVHFLYTDESHPNDQYEPQNQPGWTTYSEQTYPSALNIADVWNRLPQNRRLVAEGNAPEERP